jgi:methionyl-tRNA formyltransferase
MGSSSFAIPSLVKLFEEGFAIAGVITQPDKPSGRGQTLQSPPVKTKAFELRLPTYQPSSLKDESARTMLHALNPEMIVVAAYGKILPAWILELPKYGCVNLHASLLPKYRGAAPIHWAIANGETMTGVCTMQMDVGMDTGPVFICESTSIGPEETATELSARLAETGSRIVLQTVKGIVEGRLKPVPQNHSLATLAPILKKNHGFIDWTKPAESIYNEIRAFNPWPGTITRFRGLTCKVLKSRVTNEVDTQAAPGAIKASKRSLTVKCGNSVLLELVEIQPENRKPISGREFVNGARIQTGEKFDPVMDN